MAKEIKTNAMRILDRQKISYEVLQYDCGEFIDGIHAAEKSGTPVEQTFKTLVTRGKSGGFYVAVIPIAEEMNLKQIAKLAGEKSLEMIHVKELTSITGYIRGGCSPIGMKKQFPTFIHSSARAFDKIYISGGKVGLSLKLAPEDLAKACNGTFGDLIMT